MPPSTPYDASGISYFTILNFTFCTGLTKPIKLAYRSFNPSSSKVVLIPTCFGGRINTTLNFSTGCLSSHHVIVVAMLGNGESSSPSNDSDFPLSMPGPSVQYQDNINAQYRLLTEHFGLKELEAVIGFSMGAQQAYYWAVMHGSGPKPFVKNAVVICGSAKTSGHNYAFLEGPIAALENSSDYADGRYRENGVVPRKGLRAFGRAYAAWLTSAEWFRRGLWTKMGSESLVDWLHPAVASHESWDAEDLLVLARCWQGGDIGKVGGDGDYRRALGEIMARVLLMPSRTDQYFPPEDSMKEIKYLKRRELAPIETIWGHIGGGGANEADVKYMDGRIAEFLQEQ